MLRQLNLLRNPIQELPDYRLSILFQIQRLTELDRHKVEVDEKVVYSFRISRSLCSLFNIFFRDQLWQIDQQRVSPFNYFLVVLCNTFIGIASRPVDGLILPLLFICVLT